MRSHDEAKRDSLSNHTAGIQALSTVISEISMDHCDGFPSPSCSRGIQAFALHLRSHTESMIHIFVKIRATAACFRPRRLLVLSVVTPPGEASCQPAKAYAVGRENSQLPSNGIRNEWFTASARQIAPFQLPRYSVCSSAKNSSLQTNIVCEPKFHPEQHALRARQITASDQI